jgi:hypothetical protein
MKTFVLLLFFALSLTLLFAQTSEPVEVISKGTKFIGGSFALGTSSRQDNSNDWSSSSFSLGPTYGKYFKDNLALGVSFSYSFERSKNAVPGSLSNSHGLGLTIFLLKNYRISNNLFFELEPRVSMGFYWQNIESVSATNTYKNTGIGLGVSPGLLLFLNDRIGLRTSLGNLGYSFNRTILDGSDYTSTYHGFGFSGGLSNINFSLRYILH